MDNSKEHHELMTRLAVFEATVHGKFDSIISHLSALNGQTSKNSGAIEQLQQQDRDILSIVSSQKAQDKEFGDRQDKRDKREDSWKRRWQDLLFGMLTWFIPLLLVGLLLRGAEIVDFLGLS